MSSFKFKSAGTLASDNVNNRDRNISVSNQTIGIKTPLTNFKGDQIFDMHTDFIDQIKDNLKNVILTNRGERLGLFNFGTNLNDLLFDFGNREDFTQEVSKRIFESVKVQLPFVEIENIEVVSQERSQKTELNKKGLAGVEVQLVFSIPAARVTSQSIAVELNPGG